MADDFPRIISVDDHVVEPPHVWERWLPAKFRDRGPKVERRGIGTMRHVGGGTYEQTFDPDGPQADCWVYEDLVYIHKRHVAAVGYDRDEMTMTPMTYEEMRIRGSLFARPGYDRRHASRITAAISLRVWLSIAGFSRRQR